MLILVCHNDQLIAEVNYEKGIDKIEIEIISSQENLSDSIFSLNDFLKILEEAGWLHLTDAVFIPSSIKIKVSKDDLNPINSIDLSSPVTQKVVKEIRRQYSLNLFLNIC